MRGPFQTSFAVLMVASLLISGSLICISISQVQGSDPELVPEPQVIESHIYNEPGYQNGTQTYFNNEKWQLSISHGDVMTLLMARNLTQNDDMWVDYTFNIQYKIGDTLYIAQFMMMQMAFKIGDQTIFVPLKTCDDFELTYSPIQYNGTVPSLDCNITYEQIQIYTDGNALPWTTNSTVDLTLCHHITADWNQTDIKVEALFNFNNTRFYQSNGTEFNVGEPFTAEIQYKMLLTNPDTFSTDGPIIPTGHTNTTLEYDLRLENGSPLTMSKLKMKDDFSVYNGSGAYDSVGYSSMVYGPFTQVTHGFPNLIYKDTQSIKSDPEITVYHNRVTDNQNINNQINGNNNPSGFPLWIPIALIGGIGATAVAIVMVRRKRNAD